MMNFNDPSCVIRQRLLLLVVTPKVKETFSLKETKKSLNSIRLNFYNDKGYLEVLKTQFYKPIPGGMQLSSIF